MTDLHPRLRGLPDLVLVGDVAAILSWDPRTVRSHVIPLREWQAQVESDQTFCSEKLPGLKVGSRWYVHRFWLEEVFRMAEDAKAAARDAR